jgi:ketosteroid isomerase-like protein
MKRILFLVVILTAISAIAKCQTNPEKEVLAAIETLKKGIIDADKDILTAIAADELVYGHSSGKVQNKSEFIEEIVSKNPLDYTSVDLAEQTIKISGDVAIVRHIYSAEATSNGNAVHIRIGNMLVFQKQQGKWKLLARQAYRI